MDARVRASVLHGLQDLRLEQRPLEHPRHDEVQVLIKATTLCGSDLHYYQHFCNGDILVQEPLALGHEAAGVVSAVGINVKDLATGDRVALEVGVPCGNCERCKEGRYNICPTLRFRSSAKSFPHYQGTLQERVNHPAAWCHKLPESIPFEQGALLEPLSVAIHAVRRAQLPASASVLVLGAGAIGLLCAAVCKTKGAGKVKIADTQRSRVAFAVGHRFADDSVSIPTKKAEGLVEGLQSAKDIANGINVDGFDVVLECTGAETATQIAIYAARAGGRVVLVGMGTPILTLPVSVAALREVDLVGTFRYANAYPEAMQMLTDPHPDLPPLSRLITHCFSGLEDTEAAFQMAGKAQDEHGKLVLKVLVKMNDT